MKIQSRKDPQAEREVKVEHVQYMTTTGTFYVTLDVGIIDEDNHKMIPDVERIIRKFLEEKLK